MKPIRELARNNRLWIWVLILIVVLSTSLRVYQYRSRMLWNVEQSLTFWNIEKTVKTNKFSLVGTHFFSLVNGAVYRAPFGDWFFALTSKVLGLKVSTLFYSMLAFSILNAVFCFLTCKKLKSIKTGLIAVLLWSVSWLVNRQEMQFWYAALIIPVAGASIWLILGRDWKNTFKECFILGLILGWGFSFHFVIVWFILGVVLYLISQSPRKMFQILIPIFVGLLLMFSTLILFNFRHGQIMNNGLVNMFTGQAIKDSATLADRIGVSYNTINCLSGGLLNLPCSSPLPLVILGIGTLVLWKMREFRIQKFLTFFVIQLTVSFIGLFYAGRLGYGSQHYILYMLPLIVMLGSLLLEWLLTLKMRPFVCLVLLIYVSSNFWQFSHFSDPNSYSQKEALAKYLYSIPKEQLTVKFMDEEVLAYSGVFYLTANEYGLPFYKISMVEKWAPDRPDVYASSITTLSIAGNAIKFGDTKLLIPN